MFYQSSFSGSKWSGTCTFEIFFHNRFFLLDLVPREDLFLDDVNPCNPRRVLTLPTERSCSRVNFMHDVKMGIKVLNESVQDRLPRSLFANI